MDIHPFTLISLKAVLDRTYPQGVHVGEGSAISFGAVVLTHDHIVGKHTHTRIGRYCQIGAHSMILPGIEVGDHSVVAAGAIVTRDVPPHSIVAGNPARVIREGIETTNWGRLVAQGEKPGGRPRDESAGRFGNGSGERPGGGLGGGPAARPPADAA